MSDTTNNLTEHSTDVSTPLDNDLIQETEFRTFTSITKKELSILWGVVLLFLSAYLLCYIFGIPYASLLHAKIMYVIFVSVNIYAAYIALNAWNKIPASSLSRDMTLMFTLALCGAAAGNTIDTVLWLTNYCHFKQNLATNMIFVLSILLVLPSIHMLARLCKVRMTKEFLYYFIFITALIMSIPFITNPKLLMNIGKFPDYKEFMFGMIYALGGGYLAAFSAYIWNKAQGKLRYSARFMALGLGIMSVGCSIYAGLFSKVNPDQIPSNTIHITIALSYVLLGFCVTRIQTVLGRALEIDIRYGSPELALTELWGKESGIKMYRKMEKKIKESHSKLLQAQADMQAHGKVIKVLEEEIAKRLEAEQDMLLAKQKAELANTAKSQFLAMMSHELKTPLTAIKGYSQLMSNKSSPMIKEIPENIQVLGSRIVQNSDNLQTIIDSILNYAQLESGKFVCQIEEFPLHKTIDNLLQLISYQKQNSNCKFILNIPDEEVLLYTDMLVIRHIIVNLIINAFKFCKNGKITLELKIDNTALIIIIEDTGIGLSSQQIENVFTPFYQTSSGSKRKYGGTGLGLALVKRFTEELGGKIQVTSEENVFTKFEIIIPNIVVIDKASK